MIRKIISILLFSILFVGCSNVKTKDIVFNTQIYETPYETIEENTVTIEDLEKELQKSGIELQEIVSERLFTKLYNIHEEDMNIIILVNNRPGEKYDKTLQEIEITIWDDKKELAAHPLIKNIAKLMGEEAILSWIGEQEELYHTNIENMNEHKESPREVLYDPIGNSEIETYRSSPYRDYIGDIVTVGRNYIVFEGRVGESRKKLQFSWGALPLVSKELKGVASELENKGLLITSYIEGAGADQVKITTPEYYLTENDRYHYRYYHNEIEKMITDVEKAVSYKIMYDPNSSNGYSVQLYGLMYADESQNVKVEDMIGIDTISRVMNIDGGDFIHITKKINQELIKARKLLNPNLQREYYNEGDVGEYHYKIYVPSGIDIYHFTVFIEKNL